MKSLSKLEAILLGTADIYGKQLSPGGATLLAADLADYPEPAVITALARCRRELRAFPTIADIIARIQDGRPGVEEAWAMIPKDELGSVVWTDEMAQAFGVARQLLAVGDPVAARMAFKETYTRLVSEARESKRPARWSASFGFTREGRVQAIVDAIAKGRLSDAEARRLLPDFETVPRPRIAESDGPARLNWGGLLPEAPV